MAVVHGKIARLYWWDKTASTMTGEATDESGSQAQITATTKRRLNPNAPPVFTDTGGMTVTDIDYVNGIAYFTGNVTLVTCTGEYVLQANLAAVGYVTDWTLNITLDVVDSSAQGDAWKTNVAGLASFNGTATRFWQDSTYTAMIPYTTSPVEKNIFLVEFYVDAPAELDRYVGWAIITGVNPNASITDAIKEPITIAGFRNIAYFTT